MSRRALAAVLVAVTLLAGCASGPDPLPAGAVTGTSGGDPVTSDGTDAVPADPDAPVATGTAMTAEAAEEVIPLPDVPVPQLPVTVTSTDGVEVTVTDVSRIVVATGSIAEIVYSLALGDLVVGRDISTTFPAAADVPVVTNGHDLNAEGVLSLRPTLVLGDTTTGPPEVVAQLRAAGVPVVLVDEAWTLDDVAPRMRAVAATLGVADAGERLLARTTADIDEAAANAALSPDLRVAFLYLRGTVGVYLIGGDGSGADALVEALGATDAGSEAGLGPFTPITSEALIDAAPDVILVMTRGLDSVGGIDGLLKLPGVAQTPAGRDGRVIAVEDGLLLNFGPRTGRVLQLLAGQLGAS